MAKKQRNTRRRTSDVKTAPATGRSRMSERERRKRARRRKRRHNVFLFLCVILICVTSVGATTIFFRVSDVSVESETRYKKNELITASGIQAGDNMAFLSTGRIADRLEEMYPYLQEVKLHRQLPSTVTITFTEREPILSVENEGKYLLIDAEGRALEQVSSPAEGTILVRGAKASELTVGGYITKDKQKNLCKVLEVYKKLLAYNLQEPIYAIEVKSAEDFRLLYEDRYTILLGEPNSLEHKIQFLQAILKEPTLPYNGIIDLTDDKEARYRPTEIEITQDQAEFQTPEERAAEEAARKAAEEAAAAAAAENEDGDSNSDGEDSDDGSQENSDSGAEDKDSSGEEEESEE